MPLKTCDIHTFLGDLRAPGGRALPPCSGEELNRCGNDCDDLTIDGWMVSKGESVSKKIL